MIQMLIDVAGHAGRLQQQHRGNDSGPPRSGLAQKPGKTLKLKNRLGDEVAGPGGHLPVKLRPLEVHRPATGAGIDRGAHAEGRRPPQLHPCHVPARLELLDDFQQLHQIDIVDRPGPVMVAITGVYPRDRHDIGHPQGASRQQVSLEGQSVAVPAANLHHGFESLLLQQGTSPEGAHPHHGVAHLGDDKGIHPALHAHGVSQQGSEIHPLGRLHLGQDQELPRGQFR